jgi:nucleoside 2-deoxyribosyltransferase
VSVPSFHHSGGFGGDRHRYVYIAGPYTGNEEQNVANALAAGTPLLDAGLCPYVPHLSHYWEAQHPHHYEVWMTLDFAWIRRCDVLLRLPGSSSGADREVALAKALGIPVFYTVEEVLEWAGNAPREAKLG